MNEIPLPNPKEIEWNRNIFLYFDSKQVFLNEYKEKKENGHHYEKYTCHWLMEIITNYITYHFYDDDCNNSGTFSKIKRKE